MRGRLASGCLIGAILLVVVQSAVGVGLDEPPSRPLPSAIYEQPEQDRRRSEPTRAPMAPRQNGSNAPDYQNPCDQPKDSKEADLCQQWRMAKASEDVADLAFWQIIATSVEIVFLVAAVGCAAWAAYEASRAATSSKDAAVATKESAIATQKAADAALEANALSRQMFIAEQRARLACNISDFRIVLPLRWTGREGRLAFQTIIRNVGHTPAFDVRTLVRASSWRQCDTDAHDMMQSLRNTTGFGDALFPNDHFPINGNITIHESKLDANGRIALMLIMGILYSVASSQEQHHTIIIVEIAREPDEAGNVAIGPEFGDVPTDQLYFRPSAIRQNIIAD